MEDETMSAQSQTVIEIIERVAEREGQDPLDLPPLYESVDPHALKQLADSAKIRFEYIGYEITVRSGTVNINRQA